MEGHGSCGVDAWVFCLKEESVGGDVDEMRAFEAKVSGRFSIVGVGVWAGFAASEDTPANGFEVEKGFDVPDVEKGFEAGVLEVDPPNNWAPMLACGCAGSGTAAGED